MEQKLHTKKGAKVARSYLSLFIKKVAVKIPTKIVLRSKWKISILISMTKTRIFATRFKNETDGLLSQQALAENGIHSEKSLDNEKVLVIV